MRVSYRAKREMGFGGIESKFESEERFFPFYLAKKKNKL
jgi:hypothetical protein